MKDTTQLIADLRRYDSGEAVCELYDGGLHESAAACIEALQSQLAQYENCTAGNLLIDNLRMANEMTVLEREVTRLRKAIEDAPHGELCASHDGYLIFGHKCDCWKRNALEAK